MKVKLILIVVIVTSVTQVYCQQDKSLEELMRQKEILMNKLEVQKSINSLEEEIKFLTDKSSPIAPGIAMGIGYFTGTLEQPLVGKAKIDENGIVRVLDERKRITRIFPTISGFIRPFYKTKKVNALKNLFLATTVGVNDGVSNEGSGFAMAIGGSVGLTVLDMGHFGIFMGFVYDPTVSILPEGFVEGQQAPDGYSTNSLIETKSINARYGSVGFIFSISF